MTQELDDAGLDVSRRQAQPRALVFHRRHGLNAALRGSPRRRRGVAEASRERLRR